MKPIINRSHQALAVALTTCLHLAVVGMVLRSNGAPYVQQSGHYESTVVMVPLLSSQHLVQPQSAEGEVNQSPENLLVENVSAPHLTVQDAASHHDDVGMRGLTNPITSEPEDVLKWAAAVRAAIRNVWQKAGAIDMGNECKLALIQDSSGRVLGAHMQSCNADDPVRESLLAAVYRASPLPVYPGPRTVKPNELRFSAP